jgi:putative redox protein
MTIELVRDRSQKMKHTVHVRQHAFAIDVPASNGGEELGVRVALNLTGALTDAQRQELLNMANVRYTS